MTHFCHISPSAYLDTFCKSQTHHLLLAHLLEEDKVYTGWYVRPHRNDGRTYIMDNSGFEYFKRGLDMFPSDRLLDLAKKVKADYVVMSDYPGEKSSKTIKAAEELAPQFKQHGFGTFFVPQSEIGDIEDYIAGFAWAAGSPLVDYIGVSILGVPNAYGVESGNKMQRFFSRWQMMSELQSRGILQLAQRNGKAIHFLGMTDGWREIELCASQFKIDTWDSSAAVWAGLNGIRFDHSPTGLLNGKFEKEVDFDFTTDDSESFKLAKHNMVLIDEACVRAKKKLWHSNDPNR